MALATRRYTDEAIGFIKRNKDKPFFVYLAHTMPHVRLAASEQFRGKSSRGLYGDVIEEIDWNVGRILDALKEDGLDQNTYVIYTSDNGPWYLGRSVPHQKRIGKDAAKHGGSAAPLRGAKTSAWEGGLRVPCVVWAPGKVPAGTVCDEIASTMDMLPTLAALAGADTPADRVIDGHDIRDLIHGVQGAKSPTRAFYYYQRTRLQAVRVGKWKLHIPRAIDTRWERYSKPADAMPIKSAMLFDLEADVSETTNVADRHPDVVAQLMRHIEHARDDIGDFDRVGRNARFFDPQPKRPDIGGDAKGR
jgi:arylsulfatase A-like enzyme